MVELEGARVVTLIKLNITEVVTLQKPNIGCHESLETKYAQQPSQISLRLTCSHKIFGFARHN